MTDRHLHTCTGADLPPLGFASNTGPYDPTRFEPVTNQFSVNGKPLGGLYLCPLVEHSSGKPYTEWVALARDLWGVHLTVHPVDVASSARVLVIDSRDDFEAVAAAFPGAQPDLGADVTDPHARRALRGFLRDMTGFDYEAMREQFDTLWVTTRGARENRPMTGRGTLNTWDVETVLVLTPNVVTASARA